MPNLARLSAKCKVLTAQKPLCSVLSEVCAQYADGHGAAASPLQTYKHTPDLAFVEPGRGPEKPVSRAQQGQARQTS